MQQLTSQDRRQATLPSTMQAKSFPATSRMKTSVKVLPWSRDSGHFCFTRHAKEPQGYQVTWLCPKRVLSST